MRGVLNLLIEQLIYIELLNGTAHEKSSAVHRHAETFTALTDKCPECHELRASTSQCAQRKHHALRTLLYASHIWQVVSYVGTLAIYGKHSHLW